VTFEKFFLRVSLRDVTETYLVIQNKQPVNNQYPYSSFSSNRAATDHSYKNTKITPVLNAFHSFSANVSLKQSNEVFNVSQAAEEFYKATLDMSFGTNLEAVKKYLKPFIKITPMQRLIWQLQKEQNLMVI
jgi:hypothetical protein